MRIRFHLSKKRRGRGKIRQTLLFAGSVFLLLFCVGGLIRYAVHARRSAAAGQVFQEIFHGEVDRPATALVPRGSVIRQYEITFSKPSHETGAAVSAAPVRTGSWPDNPAMAVSAPLKSLQRQNRDVVGWLSIPGMLDQAVVQRDNSYYLRRDYLGYHNVNGALFLEESISLKTRPDTYIIFGHNMKTGEMFGSLRLYEDVGYYRRHALIGFNALYEDGQYVIFSVADIDTLQGMGHYAPFMQLPGMEARQRAACIQKLQAYSRIYSPVPVNADDQLLLLVTCDGAEESRRVVAARRLRDGESAESIAAVLENAKKRQ